MKITKDWILGGGIALALVLALVGIGGNDQSKLEAKIDTLTKAITEQIGQVFGATANRLPHGYWDTADGYYVDGLQIVDGNGALTGVVTSTIALQLPKVDVAITQVATTTAANPGPAAAIQNTTGTKLCLAPSVFLTTANGLWQSQWAVGTTTCRVAGADCLGANGTSYTNTSTATLVAQTIDGIIATSTTGLILHPERFAGSAYVGATQTPTSSVPWVWKTGEWLLAVSNEDLATSDNSWLPSGGFTTPLGKLVTECWNAY